MGASGHGPFPGISGSPVTAAQRGTGRVMSSKCATRRTRSLVRNSFRIKPSGFRIRFHEEPGHGPCKAVISGAQGLIGCRYGAGCCHLPQICIGLILESPMAPMGHWPAAIEAKGAGRRAAGQAASTSQVLCATPAEQMARQLKTWRIPSSAVCKPGRRKGVLADPLAKKVISPN